MFESHRIVKLFILLFVGLITSNCALKAPPKAKRDASFYPYPATRREDFSEEAARLERIARYHPDSSVRAEAHLKLALIYSNYKNPASDYSRALKELETYLSLAPPDGDGTDEIQNWAAVLRELEKTAGENQKMKEDIKLLTKENRKMKRRVKFLAGENQKMKETIEELRHLDLQLEKKRRDIR